MSDVFEHNLGDHEDPLTGPTWIIGFLGAVLLAVIMLGLTALLYNAQRQEAVEKVIQRDPQELENLRAAQAAQLAAAPRWIEQTVEVQGQPNGQIVRSLAIPIDQAMELVVRESQQGR